MVTGIKLDIFNINKYLDEQAKPLRQKFSSTKNPAELFKYLPNINILKLLKEHTNLTKIAANRHFCATGFLRTFEVEYAAPSNLPENIENKIILFLPENDDEKIDAGKLAQENKSPDTIFGILEYSEKIINHIKNLQIYYILKDTDKVSELNLLFEKTSTELLFSAVDWFHQGKKIEFADDKEFNSLLSDIFDDKFRCGLSINNEFLALNKSNATLTKAMRNLVIALIENKEIKQNSVEQSIYTELLSEIHNNGLFKRPYTDFKLAEIWDEIEIFIHKAEKRKNLSELFTNLKSAPYGLSNSIVSILLLAVILGNKEKVSIYEKGSFQLKLTPLLYDRLINAPENFDIQKVVFEGSKREFFEKFSQLVLNKQDASLLELVKTIISFVNSLDKYTKFTGNLSQDAVKLRDAVLNAKDPYNLIFKDIPVALGFNNTSESKKEDKDIFFNKLGMAFKEIKENYNLLLSQIEETLYKSFNITSDKANKIILFKRMGLVKSLISEDDLKVFVNNVQEKSLPYDKWLERIATFVNKSRIPRDWNDKDLTDFNVKVVQFARKIKNLEPVAMDMNKSSFNFDNDLTPIRFSMNIPNEFDSDNVFFIKKNEPEKVDGILKRMIEKAFNLPESQRVELLTALHRSFKNA